MSKASRLKGHCNRLFAISELPAHQAKTWWCFSWFLGKGVFLVRMYGLLLLAVCTAVGLENASGLCGRFFTGQRGTRSDFDFACLVLRAALC